MAARYLPRPPSGTSSTLYFGDDPGVTRRHVRNEAVALVYLDPPLSPNADHSVLFDRPRRHPAYKQRRPRSRSPGGGTPEGEA